MLTQDLSLALFVGNPSAVIKLLDGCSLWSHATRVSVNNQSNALHVRLKSYQTMKI